MNTSKLSPGMSGLLTRVKARRDAAGLRVHYVSPYTGERKSYVAADEANKADFCRRVVDAGGAICEDA